MTDTAAGNGISRFSPWFWGASFIVAMFGAGIFARVVDLDAFWSMAIMVPPMLLLIPMIRSSQKRGVALGCMSPALVQYNRRALIWSFTYVIALLVAVMAQDRLEPKGPLLWLIAMLPALPVFYFVHTLRSYLREEQDEYLRMNFVEQALWGLGLLLVLATFWGFLESFGVVPHAPGWLALPVWAIGMGIAGFLKKMWKA